MRTSAIYMNYILIVDEGLISSLKLSDATHVQLITSYAITCILNALADRRKDNLV